MTEYGVTKAGFVIKPFQQILDDMGARAREVFGADIDLHETSALRQILDVSAAACHEQWKVLEQAYHAGFASTASGEALDLIGEASNAKRRQLAALGTVTLTIAGPEVGRSYHFPIGTLVETDPPVAKFRTLARLTLSADARSGKVAIEATERGLAGKKGIGEIKHVNQQYAKHYLNLGAASITVVNEEATRDWDKNEDDAVYRRRLLGRPRALWTLEAVHRAVLDVDGVRDCRVLDPFGGVDVSLSKYKMFQFGRRRYGTQRITGSPYFFDILVATKPGFDWNDSAAINGVRTAVERAVAEVRPVSIFPNLRLANTVFVGIRARLVTRPGHDPDAIRASIADKLQSRIGRLGLGRAILYSEVVCDCMSISGVIDVRDLRLRRCPPRIGTIGFGRSPRFGAAAVEAAVGENLELLPDEVGVVEIESALIDLTGGER